jgi:alginate O-acetyltransferase complex protein AlgI
MLFNSFIFLLFFPTFFTLYWLFNNKKLAYQNLIILIASYFFYSFWSLKFAGLLILSTILDFVYGILISSNNRKKAKFFLGLSIINNLGILAVFKYYNFFIEQLISFLSLFNLTASFSTLNIVLPVGISFYTFHGLSYVFDIYNKKQKPLLNFVGYAVFVSFFPLLVAGPIERANHLLPQILTKRKINYTQFVEGCRLILWGFFKKLLIADNLGIFVDQVYSNFQDFTGITLLLASVAFSIQIYADFSGYSDIAIGTSKLLGFELLSNFKFPYFSQSINEFWKRWHLSLSSWFKDYLYIPLGGSRVGLYKTIRNIFLVFILSGFWHGASWNYILWGALHGFAYIPNVIRRNQKTFFSLDARNKQQNVFKKILNVLLTFTFINFTWLIFRMNNINQVFEYLHLFISTIQIENIEGKRYITYIFLFVLIEYFLRNNERELRVPKNIVLRWGCYSILLFLIGMYMATDTTNFIYFQF